MDKNSYLIQLSESDAVAFGKVEFLGQSEEQKVFSAVWALESQVNNGGFSQYISSWDGETANFAPTALRRIGAQACASIVERALAAVSVEELPQSHEERSTLVEALGSEQIRTLEALDAEFLAYPNNLTELLFKFVSANPDAFGPVPKSEG
jgi:Domain of unknown function (DUF4375)